MKIPAPHPLGFVLGFVLGFLLASIVLPARAQNVPSDLEVIGTAGGLAPHDPYAVVRIDAGGIGTYAQYASTDVDADPAESSSFTATPAEVEQLWQAIQENDFFNLDASYAAEGILDRTFAELIVTANGSTHRVTTRNVAVEGFDGIVAAVNELTPGDDDLVFDTSEPFTFTPLDICEQFGKEGAAILTKPVGKGSIARGSVPRIRDGGGVLGGADGGKLIGPVNPAGSAAGGADDPFDSILDPAASDRRSLATHSTILAQNGGAHPGTSVAYRMSLQEAVNRGIVSLSGKGGTIFGDGVSIDIDNANSSTSDRLELTLYLEFWGPAATTAVSAAVESAIESIWGGKTTSGGQTLDVDVITRTSPGATAPPGTAGFHQIRMVLENSAVSHVHGEFDVNDGVGGGVWETNFPITDDLIKLYAHEAGHLFGLPDRYEDYSKQADGTWERESDGETFTSSQLADEIAPYRPDLTHEQILAKLEDGRRRATHPQPGSENDLMARISGEVQQFDIDTIAQQAGLIIEIRPGDILVNGQDEQNYVITRSEDVFVPAGESKTLGGLYVACIDLRRSVPSEGTVYDVAPSLSEWRGIAAAGYLQQVVDYIDAQAFFCPFSGGGDSQSAIWRISDNHFSTTFGYEPIEAFLLEAGVDIGDRILDFPRMSDPTPDDSTTTVRSPRELVVANISSSSSSLLEAGAAVNVTGSVEAPEGAIESAAISWALDAPNSSSASLTAEQGESTGFTADVRGFYQIHLQADVTDSQEQTFEVESNLLFTTADALTETFETGTIRAGRPFYWEMDAENPWTVTDLEPNSGGFSTASANIDHSGTTSLAVAFDHVADEPFSFAYRVSSEGSFDVLEFSVDDGVVQTWSGETGWSSFTVDLSGGAHRAEWTYRKDESVSSGADRAWVDDVFFPESATFVSIERPAGGALPTAFELAQNYPNPFNPTTTITFGVPRPEQVTLRVYDALGRQIATLVDGPRNAGNYEVRFDARNLPNGVYHYVLRAGTFEERKAMVLLR